MKLAPSDTIGKNMPFDLKVPRRLAAASGDLRTALDPGEGVADIISVSSIKPKWWNW